MKWQIMLEKIILYAKIPLTWLITRFYYQKAGRDQMMIMNKIPEELIKALHSDRREKLTVKELNELLESKTLDKTKTGLDTFKVCPKCGSAHLSRGTDWEVDDPDNAFQYNVVYCADCDWREDDLHG